MKSTGIVLLVAALLAGAGIGYVVGAGTASAPPAASPPAPAEPEATEDPPVAEVPLPDPGDHGTLEDWLAAIPAPATASGDGEITGRVTTKAGRPVARVLIRGTPKRKRTGGASEFTGAPPKDRTLSEVVEGAVNQHRQSLAGRKDVRTDQDGRFRLTGLGEGPYYLRAWLEGYRLRLDGSYLVEVGSDVRFVAEPFYRIRALVLGPGGETLETARIRIAAGGSSDTAQWSRSEPRIEMRSGTWSVSAWSGDHNEFRSDPVQVVVGEGVAPPSLELHCDAVRGIRGRVILPEGMKPHSFEVAAVPLASGTPADPKRLLNSVQSAHVWGSDRDYSFTDIAAGTWLVGVVENSRVLVSETARVGDGLTVLDLEIPPPDRSEYVVVTVLGPDDQPLDDVSFHTEYQVEGAHSGGGSRVEKLGSGRWRVWHHTKPEGYDEGGEYGIEARAQGYGSKKIWYDRANTTELTFRFDEPGILVVTVSGYVGSGLEGMISLSLSSAGEKRTSSGSGASRMSAEGVQRLRPAPPGEYLLNVYIRRNDHENARAASVPITLVAGENQRTVAAPRVYTLTVLTEGLPESTRLRLRPRDRGGWWGTDRVKPRDGRVVFERLPAGEYVVEGGRGMEMMFVTVPGKAIVRFEPSPVNALEVQIRDEEGTLAKAGFRDGDLIIGVDGTEFENVIQMQSLFGQAMAKDKTTFTVQRGSQRLDIEVNMRALMEGNDGGSMEPAVR